MAALRRSRHLCSFILFAGILAVPVVPASAQVLAFGPMQNYQPGFPQYAPQTAPQSDAAPSDQLAPELRHQIVAYQTTEPAGVIVIDTAHKFLYLTMGGGKAMRYGIGVGRQGFTWSGVQTISRIHGTNDPTTIGKNVSSGCIRLENSEVQDLYSRVAIGTKVIVLPNDPHASAERISMNDGGGVAIDQGRDGRMSAQIAIR
jgi:lipoprotein-anchoring transpeptidase ErfK/SrfK